MAAYGGLSSVGPTYDGRSKPDITAPASATSFSTPQVSGAAAILLQAAERGDAGAGTESDASDSRVLKALLLNGAVKPQGWANTPTAPLDPRYGAGIANVYNSYLNLKAGEYASSGVTSGSVGSIRTGTIVPDEGWNLATITSLSSVSGTDTTYTTESDHYLFDLSAATARDFRLTCTLTWWRQFGETAINNLDLYLFNASTGTTIAMSDSTVDNVQELYPMHDGEPLALAPGEYDIVVAKRRRPLHGQRRPRGQRFRNLRPRLRFRPAPRAVRLLAIASRARGTGRFPPPEVATGQERRILIQGVAAESLRMPVWLGRGCLPGDSPNGLNSRLER